MPATTLKFSTLSQNGFLAFLLLFSFIAKAQSSHELDSTIQKYADRKAFQGFGVALVNADGILFEKGYGSAYAKEQKRYEVHTIQNIASVSKVLVGLALCKAVDQGKVRLDDAVSKYLPFKVENPLFPGSQITFRQLATHTSSVTDNAYYFSKNYYLKADQDTAGLNLVFDSLQVLNPAGGKISVASLSGKHDDR